MTINFELLMCIFKCVYKLRTKLLWFTLNEALAKALKKSKNSKLMIVSKTLMIIIKDPMLLMNITNDYEESLQDHDQYSSAPHR